MTRHLVNTAAVALLCMSAAACSIGREGPSGERSTRADPTFATVDNRFVVRFPTDRDQLASAEKARLDDFVENVGRSRVESVVVIGHADERQSDLYNLDLSARRTANVVTVLEEMGFDPQVVDGRALGETMPARRGSDPASLAANRRVEVVLRSSVASPRRCDDWSQPVENDPENLPLANLGCATYANLAQMAARPGDLRRGRSLGPADGVYAAAAVQRYHEDEVKDLQVESTN